jgi:hypothetical protein
LKATWMKFEIRQPIDEIHDFGEQIAALGKKHHSPTIEEYGNELCYAADSFNIESILSLVKKYPDLANSLKSS